MLVRPLGALDTTPQTPYISRVLGLIYSLTQYSPRVHGVQAVQCNLLQATGVRRPACVLDAATR